MDSKYNSLFTPWKIGNCDIKNRIVLCPMGGTSLFGWMQHCHFDKTAANYCLDKAKNEVGLIIPGIAPLRDTLGGAWLYKHPSIFKPLKPLMADIHSYGAKLFVQLTAGFGRSFSMSKMMALLQTNKILGFCAKPILNISYLSASPSELPSRWSEWVKCRELKEKEIKQMVKAFAETAYLCKINGVDGVEVHAVHEGYLLDQFTTSYTNFRTDEYGGSFENRYRFAVEVVQAIKAKCGENFPVSLRYSVVSMTKGFQKGALPEERGNFKEVGRDMDESEKAAKYLQDAGYDCLNCDNGTYDAWYWNHPPVYMPLNCNLEETIHIKKFVSIPVICAGRMSLERGAEAIDKNEIDGVGIARQFLTDTQYITKVKENRIEDIKPCICCHNACFPIAKWKGVGAEISISDATGMARCALTPATMDKAHRFVLKPIRKKKHIAVIGGGIGGMESAMLLAKRGYDVTLYEKTNELGGVFIAASSPEFKEKDRELIAWYRHEIIKYKNIEIKFNVEIKDLSLLKEDEIIIATGAKARKLNIPGIEKSMEAVEFLSGKEVGKRVAIVGGGLTGCEIAYELFLKGKTPIIIEMQDDLMKGPGLCYANSSFLKDYFEYHKIEVHLETKLSEIKDGSILITDKNGNLSSLNVDSVIISAGYVPGSPLIEKPNRKVHFVGDANGVGNLRTVIWGAWDLCKNL